MFSEPSQASTMELFVEIINGFHPLIIFIKGFNLDISPGSKYSSVKLFSFTNFCFLIIEFSIPVF